MYRYGAAVALLALVACSAEHAGSLPSLPPATSVPPLRTVPPSDPATTPAAQVEAAARRYFAALETAGRTGDVTDLDALVGTRCPCHQQVDAIRADAKAGRHVTTTYTVEAVRTHDVRDDVGLATVTYSSPPSKLLDKAGRTLRVLPARSHAGLDLGFGRDGGAWVLLNMTKVGP
jgi:hypothetical protein